VEFEVAFIKPSPPDYRFVRCRGAPARTIEGCGPAKISPLANYLIIAYRVRLYQLSAPDWMSNARFTVQAKLPDGATKEQQSMMLQNLLTDRFKLKVHRETRSRELGKQ
jgi:uncharacterized protein (TIGR03435 family)